MLFRIKREKFLGRAVAAVAIAGITAISLSGCFGQPTQSSDDSATSGTIDWWGWSPTPALAELYIDAFNEEYPDITVNYKYFENDAYVAAMRPALASSTGPDVFGISGGRPNSNVHIWGGSALDIEPAAIEALGEGWEDLVAPSGIDAFTTDEGKLAALALGYVAAGTVWINKDIFDTYGLTAPTDLEEWKEVCGVLRSNGVGCLTAGAGQGIFNLDTLHAISDTVDPGFWNRAAQGEEEWTSPTFVRSLEIWKELSDSEILDPGSLGLQQYPDANNVFLSQKSAMIQMGTWYRQYSTVLGATAGLEGAGVADPVPFTMIPVPFPDVAGDGQEPTMFADADYGIAVNAKSDSQNAATTFAVWLTTSEAGQSTVANALDVSPSLIGAAPVWDDIELVNEEVQRPVLEELAETTGSLTEARNRLLSVEVSQAIQDVSIAVLDGTMTPEEAVEIIQAAMG